MAPEADCTTQPDSCSSGQQLETPPLVPECQSAAVCASPQGPAEGAMEGCERQGSNQALFETGKQSQQQRHNTLVIMLPPMEEAWKH